VNSTDLKASLRIGDQVQYRCANPLDAGDFIQNAWSGPYDGIVVGVNAYTCEVRSDGWWGAGVLYRPFFRDILSVNGQAQSG